MESQAKDTHEYDMNIQDTYNQLDSLNELMEEFKNLKIQYQVPALSQNETT